MMWEALIPLAALAADWIYRRHRGTREFVQKAARATFGQATRALAPSTDKEALRSIYRRLFDAAAEAAGIRTVALGLEADKLFDALYDIWAREQWDNAMMDLAALPGRAERFLEGLKAGSTRALPGGPP